MGATTIHEHCKKKAVALIDVIQSCMNGWEATWRCDVMWCGVMFCVVLYRAALHFTFVKIILYSY